jgi:hypothetical protein
MEQNEKAAINAKRKKRGLLPLEEKMGLDKTTDYMSPSAPSPDLARPGMFPNAAASTLEDGYGAMGDRVRGKIKERRGV